MAEGLEISVGGLAYVRQSFFTAEARMATGYYYRRGANGRGANGGSEAGHALYYSLAGQAFFGRLMEEREGGSVRGSSGQLCFG